MTLKPASANALAISKCVWFGVATETKSMRSLGGQLLLGGDHLLVGAVGAFGGDVVVGGGRLGLGRVGRQGAGDEGGAVVEDGGDAVDAADEGALAAADQAHAKLAIQRCVDAHAVGSFRVIRNETLVIVVGAEKEARAWRHRFSPHPKWKSGGRPCFADHMGEIQLEQGRKGWPRSPISQILFLRL